MNPRLEVRDVLGDRTVPVDKLPFLIGRRETNGLRLGGSEVSREHAEIAFENGKYMLRDRQSRYGTFVNGEQVTECEIRSGDAVRLGRGGGADLIFMTGTDERQQTSGGHSTTGARDDLRQITSLLEGFRALGQGRVLQEVLTLVLDAAIELSNGERAFIMLANQGGELEFRLARGRNKQPLKDETFNVSRKIPEEVFTTGKTRVVADLLDSGNADHGRTVALGIRHIVCVPLNLVRYIDSAEARSEDRRIGVLYLDSREKGQLLSTTTRSALETLAGEASVAIENANLYREKLEKAKMESEMRIAAEIQQALLPKPVATNYFVEAAAASIPCRSIGGDFFDYLDEASARFGFALGDVAGKGPPAALMSALMQGMFAANAGLTDTPAPIVTGMNKALCRRGLESRFVTLMFGIINADGKLIYCNAGHNPPIIVGKSGVRRLEVGGPVVGLLDFALFDQDTVTLDPGDTVVVFSDGVSEALNAQGEEFGDGLLLDAVQAAGNMPAQLLVERVIAAVREFTRGAAQSDDITVMVVRYLGPSA